MLGVLLVLLQPITYAHGHRAEVDVRAVLVEQQLHSVPNPLRLLLLLQLRHVLHKEQILFRQRFV